MNYSAVTEAEVSNGIGIRVVLWVSGCDHHCKNCHNPETWDADAGKPFTFDVYDAIVKHLNHEYVSGLTFSGGDPLKPENTATCMMVARSIKQKFPSKDIWCWTGYTLDELKSRPDAMAMLQYVDYLVDGEYVDELHDISLHWRGSSNQKIYKKVGRDFVDVTKELG